MQHGQLKLPIVFVHLLFKNGPPPCPPFSRPQGRSLARYHTRLRTAPNKMSDTNKDKESGGHAEDETVAAVQDGTVLNASGYKDQLKRQYGLLGLCGIALTVDNAWVALGSSLSVSLGVYCALQNLRGTYTWLTADFDAANGGPTGVIFGLVVAIFYYSFIGLGLAEACERPPDPDSQYTDTNKNTSQLSSSMPTSGGVYHWTFVAAGPKWGRMLGFWCGYINFYGWIFDFASLLQVTANISVNLYLVYHQDYVPAAWHVYVAYVLITWFCVLVAVFGNRLVPHLQSFGLFLVVVGGLVTIVVLAAMPARHASHASVWASFDENNTTGWPAGVAFLCGVLNGAFTIGTPDSITHLAEELAHPRRDLPKAIGLQLGLGFLYAFVFAIAIAYSISDIGAITTGINTYPLANIYRQVTTDANGNQNLGAQFGLLFIIWCSSFLCCIGTIVTVCKTFPRRMQMFLLMTKNLLAG